MLINSISIEISNLIMKLLKSLEFWEGRNEGGVHVVGGVRHELVEGPEDLLLLREVHEQEGRHLGHPLAVADLRVVHAVGCQHVEEVLLLGVVSLPEHDVVPVSSVDVKVNLTDLLAVEPAQLPG